MKHGTFEDLFPIEHRDIPACYVRFLERIFILAIRYGSRNLKIVAVRRGSQQWCYGWHADASCGVLPRWGFWLPGWFVTQTPSLTGYLERFHVSKVLLQLRLLSLQTGSFTP